VKKLDTSAPLVHNEHDFLGLVGNIACLWHANITELVGYCVEHGQWLLVNEYMSTTAMKILWSALSLQPSMIKRVDLGICGSCLVNRPALWRLPPLLGWHLCYWMELVNKWLAFGTAACKYIALHWLGLALWGRSWASSQVPCLKFI
jgi:hypothetical protein